MEKDLKPGNSKILFPSRKTEQELMIFKEIFVEPKEKELQKFKQQTDSERRVIEQRMAKLNFKKKPLEPKPYTKNVELNHSNMVNNSQHDLLKTIQTNFKKSQNDYEISDDEGGSADEEEDKEEMASTYRQSDTNLLNELINNTQDDLVKIVLRKFNHKRGQKGNPSFFVQQIHVQPPEGLNATVAAPLTPGGGWAPSIPHVNPNLMKTSLKDLTIRAKAGVQAGDVQKEAHMAYNLAALSEEKKFMKKSIRFYKRFFF